MTSAHKALLVGIIVTTLGLWGCAQNHNGTGTAKLRDLEARNAKLEEDYKAAVAESVDVRKKLSDTEGQVAQLSQQAQRLRGVQKERDQLRRQMTTTQSERNALQSRLQEFSHELQALAGRVDAAAGGNPSAPVTSATSTPTAGSL